MDITDLKRIGLTDGEVKVYQALLEFGETTRTLLAKRSGVSPSKIYDVANSLLEKGIISAVKKNGVLHFSPANPTRLKEFLEKKQSEIRSEMKVVDSMLPSLLSRFTQNREDIDIEVFYGWEGMKTVFDDLASSLKKGDENLVLGASQGLDPMQSDIFFSQYYKKVDKQGYKIRVIFNEELRSNPRRTKYFLTHPIHKARFLHQETFSEMNVYKDTVLMILLTRKPVVIRVKSQEAADSFRKFFATMWSQAKP